MQAQKAVAKAGGVQAFTDKNTAGTHSKSKLEDVVGPCSEQEKQRLMSQLLASMRQRMSPSVLPSALVGLDAQKQEVKSLFEGCITRGANGSALLVGARGRGKTAVVRSVLQELEKTYAFPGFVTVHLNGAVDTSDHLALKSISRQLYTMDDLNADTEFELVS